MNYRRSTYEIANPEALPSPALIFYPEIIRKNTQLAISMAGGPERLIPHIKTHKMADVVRMQMSMGIAKFKCATIAEAEMLAQCGVADIVLSYPLVGPAIGRFHSLRKAYPGSRFWAIGDNLEQLAELGKQAASTGGPLPVLVDVNMGMNRTGVPIPELSGFCLAASGLPGLELRGLHCYDGQNDNPDLNARNALAEEKWAAIRAVLDGLQERQLAFSTLIAGGTPSFPSHISHAEAWLSPGTCFIQDSGYGQKYPDLPFVPGAAILTRIVSHPSQGLFTLDCGTKAIASDPATRGLIVGVNADPVLHSEEHWVFRMNEGTPPPIGSEQYVLPTHICPTTALYPEAVTVAGGLITGTWEVTARNRGIGI